MNKEHKINIEYDTEEKNSNKDVLNVLKPNIIYLIGLVVIIIGILYIYKNNNEYTEYSEIENAIEIKEETKEIEKNKTIVVHITGEVKNPGVYELSELSRVGDAIDIAGGITNNANLENINLAYQISDGQKIKIPCINEENNGNYIIESDGITMNNEKDDGKLDINSAGKNDLMQLPGIGESTAQKIISYREENGKFKNIEEIKNVSGIGENRYNQIQELIKVK